MQATVKSLHLILYSIDEQENYNYILEDAIFFDPNYKVGDTIEILSTSKHDAKTGEIISYKILQIQKIIVHDKTDSLPNEHKLFVKISKAEGEVNSSNSNNTSFIIKGNQTAN